MNIPGLGTYAASKAAFSKLSDTARCELADDNIRVVTFYPRSTATDFGKNALADPEARTRWAAGFTRGKFERDTPEAVAAKILEAAINEPAEYSMGE
jgi:NAD(P)-dependent dehydrogenase (short-subunit alcohol dehydrogenase family)